MKKPATKVIVSIFIICFFFVWLSRKIVAYMYNSFTKLIACSSAQKYTF